MVHKYLFKAFYSKKNKKEYDIQIRQYNVRHFNVIAMKEVIGGTERNRKNQGSLAKKVDKAAMTKVAKVLRLIDMSNKYRWAISNVEMDAAKNPGLISVKKYWRCAGQVQTKVN